MQKLELKHLAGYLPYELKVWDSFGEGGVISMNGSGIIYCMEFTKPILRPLSDLTKEIEHNGLKIIPVVEIMRIKDNGDWLGVQKKPIYENPYYVIQKLYEWHFDIHGGIGTWAIDINTLNK